MKEQLPDLGPLPPLEPQQARFRLFDSINAFLKRASQSRPLVLVMDNLHWADRPSLQLLEFVARELASSRLLLLGTYRDVELTRRHPLTQTLGELAREPVFRRVTLRGLSQEEVKHFIEATSRLDPTEALVEAVHTQTEGNPLFLTQVVQLLDQEGGLEPDPRGESPSWTVRIPVGVHEAIGRRLDGLSEGCNQVLTVASVVGREFELKLLEPLLPAHDPLEALEEAITAGIIEELPNAAGRYQFAHVLFQNTLNREVSAARQARLHGRIAESLEILYQGNLEAHVSELAHHSAQAAPVSGPEKLIRYSLLAGERALATQAHEEALDHFQRGLEAKEGQTVDAETATLLFGLGRAQVATLPSYQMQEAINTLTRTLDYCAEALATHPVPVRSGHLPGLTQLIARALALVPPDSHEAGGLLSYYGRVLGQQEGDYEGAQEAFAQALAIAQGEDDAALQMSTLTHAARVDLDHLRWQESLEKSLRAVGLADRADDPHCEVAAHFWAALALMGIRDLEAVRPHATAMLAVAERLRDRYWLASAFWVNERVCSLGGDWQAARDFSNRGLSALSTDPRLLGTRAVLEYGMGDFGQGEAHQQQLMWAMRLATPGPSNESAYPAIAIPLIAYIAGEDAHLDVAPWSLGGAPWCPAAS